MKTCRAAINAVAAKPTAVVDTAPDVALGGGGAGAEQLNITDADPRAIGFTMHCPLVKGATVSRVVQFGELNVEYCPPVPALLHAPWKPVILKERE